ncbi:hypothetical protein K4F52_008564 [Lecanicillium sp. MT-2017a]|nr:hypothetical protein K4F52_008564 [Lecanicillium sp. MT-2017a]
MKFLNLLAALAGAAMAAPSVHIRAAASDSTVARPGTVADMEVTKENTLNGTSNEDKQGVTTFSDISAQVKQIPLELVNNFGGGQVNAYIQGKDSQGRVVFVRADGSLVYPTSGGSAQPVPIRENIKIPLPGRGQRLRMNLPIALDSGRIYFAEGELQFGMVRTGDGGDGLVQPSVTNLSDPSAGINWGFVELTYTPQGAIFANISYVDFVGMILSMGLTSTDGNAPQITRGLDAGAMPAICDGVRQQGNRDGRPWGKMCITNQSGNPVRVLSPNDYSVIDHQGFADYWTDYVNRVYDKYSREPLVINTQTGAGRVNCRVSGNQMRCDRDERPYNKPSAEDIWGCNGGPFENTGSDLHKANLARLCAAFVRSTLLLDGGNVTPSLGSSHYYKVDPTNHYSRLVHEHEVDGKGYAFPYDDVNPDGNENASGTVATGNPDTLTVYVGAPPP